MRPNHLLLIGCLSVLSLLWSCSIKSDLESSRPDFSIEEARSVFEQAISGAASKSSSNVSASHKSRLSPGEFVPVWEDAVYSKEDGVPSYSVPILSQYKLYSYFGPYSTHRISERRRVVRQELVVSKCPDCPQGKCEIRSTVKRPNLRQTEPFTGLIINTDLVTNSINTVGVFCKGTLRRELTPFSPDGIIDTCQLVKISRLLSYYCIAKKENSITKSDGDEDDPFGNDEDEKEYTYIGNGLYMDENGNIWDDSNDDGDPDFIWLNTENYGTIIGEENDDFFDSIDWDAMFELMYGTTGSYVIGTSFSPKSSTKLAWNSISTSASPSQYYFENGELFAAFSYCAQSLGINRSQSYYYNASVSVLGNTIGNGLHPFYARYLVPLFFSCSSVSNRQGIKNSIDSGKIVLGFLRDQWNHFFIITIIGYDAVSSKFIYVEAASGRAYEEDSTNSLPLTLPAFSIIDLY